MTKAASPHLKTGSSIINTASITAFYGGEYMLTVPTTCPYGGFENRLSLLREGRFSTGGNTRIITPGLFLVLLSVEPAAKAAAKDKQDEY